MIASTPETVDLLNALVKVTRITIEYIPEQLGVSVSTADIPCWTILAFLRSVVIQFYKVNARSNTAAKTVEII